MVTMESTTKLLKGEEMESSFLLPKYEQMFAKNDYLME